ncbi:MAG: hypothetical protein JSR47_11220 [Proteobacteria bacterium]|nr:hypothetical protein [Pseudomonadota bacterium]
MPDSLTYFSPDSAQAPEPVTIRKRASADEIRADLNERVARLIARDPKFTGCEIAAPRAIAVRADGAPNWTVDGFTGLASGCFTALVKIVDQARLEYELVA